MVLLIFAPFIMVSVFDNTNGEKVLEDTIVNVTGNINTPDEKALAIMAWEIQYFDNPYSLFKKNSTLNKYWIYKIDGKYKLFIRPSPVSWIIHSKLANCGEYAIVFVTLMNEAGIDSRLIQAPAEDHMWAEYMYGNYRIAIDPSQNHVIGNNKKEFEKFMGVKFSYVEAIDSNGNRIDVSDEYIERSNLTVSVLNEGVPVSDVTVIIKNPFLVENRGDKYNKPLYVISKKTDENGNAYFKLGIHKYVIETRLNNLFLFDSVYRKNTTVEVNKENLLNFSLENDEYNIEFIKSR